MKTVIEMAREAGFNKNELAYLGDNFTRFAELVRADERDRAIRENAYVMAEREALIRYFDGHWREEWSDGQIIEALEARSNT